MAGEKTEFWVAEGDIKALAEELIRKHHPEALDANICYMMRNKHSKSGGRVLAGYCQKQSDQQKLLHDYDYVITIAADIWSELKQAQREALLLHEIKHICATVDDDGDVKMSIRPHDTEEFRDVIQVYGLWSSDLEALAQAIETSKKGQ